MNTQLGGALRAATDRAFQHRKMLRKASVWLRFWPQGLVISCQITASVQAELEAGRQEEVPWDQLAELTAERAIEIVDRVCLPAHQLLGAAGAA